MFRKKLIWFWSKKLSKKSSIGSRKTPHRLRNYERIKYELALKNNYLEIDNKDRVNLQKLWQKVCDIKKLDNIILYKNLLESKIFKNGKIIFFGNIKDAKIEIKKILGKHL